MVDAERDKVRCFRYALEHVRFAKRRQNLITELEHVGALPFDIVLILRSKFVFTE